MSDLIFPKGVQMFPKRDNAPDFVIGTIVITLPEFKEFVNSNPDLLSEYQGKKQIRINALKSKSDKNKITLTVDTYKPKAKEPEMSMESDINPTEPLPDLPF